MARRMSNVFFTCYEESLLDIKEIKQIIDLMKRARLAEFEIHEGDFSLRLVREGEQAPAVVPVTQPPFPVAAPPAPTPTPEAPTPPIAEGKVIKSPMVGTFYTAPSPDSAPFVQVGDAVSPEKVVCIVEAMKVMNEIVAEVGGTIDAVLVDNGTAVEFGQPLFRLK